VTEASATPKLIACPDGSHTLHSEHFDQSYHSVHGALTECQHIFIDGCGLAQRFKDALPTRILEIGFGLGLNCLLSADLALSHKAPLYFHSLENDLLNTERSTAAGAKGARPAS